MRRRVEKGTVRGRAPAVLLVFLVFLGGCKNSDTISGPPVTRTAVPATATRTPVPATATPTPGPAAEISGTWTGTSHFRDSEWWSPCELITVATAAFSQVGSEVTGRIHAGCSGFQFRGTLLQNRLTGTVTGGGTYSYTGAASGTASSAHIDLDTPKFDISPPPCAGCTQVGGFRVQLDRDSR